MSGFIRPPRATLVALGLACNILAQTHPGSAAVRVIEKPATIERAPDSGLPVGPELNNEVGLTLEILPRAEVELGAKLTFRLTAKRAGYVVLIDADPTGKLAQLFPNLLSLQASNARRGGENRVAPNAPLTIPQAGSNAYEFVASAPVGVGMLVAIFSEAPLDVVDLPDVPAALAGQGQAASFVRDAANSLRIVAPDAPTFQEPKFSFAARFYRIR